MTCVRLLRFSMLVALVASLLACAPASEETTAVEVAPAPEPLTIYSGRNERLIGPLLERFEAEKGIPTEVRYAGTAELAATILEEGANSPCDVFIGQDAGALGALSQAGVLRPLPESTRQRVPAWAVGPKGDWVGLSGRARTVVYNTERITPEELPQDLDQAADPRYKGRFGVAPANASFQAHMAVYRATNGPEALDTLLSGLVANEPLRYPKNSAIVEAVINGEIDWGLTNHYYLWRALAERPEAPAKNHTMTGGGVATFLNLAGAGVMTDRPEALALVSFLLEEAGQRYFAEETFEYPLVSSVAPSVALAPLESFAGAQVDFAEVGDALQPTLDAIAESGLLQ